MKRFYIQLPGNWIGRFNMKIFVIGGSGLLGSEVSRLAVEIGYDVYSSYNKNIPKYGKPVRLNLIETTLIPKVIERIAPDVIIHTAALTNVDKCETEKREAYKINYIATEVISKAYKPLGGKLIYISTDYVFDGERGLYSEGDTPNPINYYGYTKYKGEQSVSTILDDYLIVRTSVLYGPTPPYGKKSFVQWIIENLSLKRKIKVVKDQWNSPTLTTNLGQMILECIEKDLKGVIHLAGRERISRYTFALKVADIFGFESDLIEAVSMDDLNWIARRPRDSSLNVKKAMETLKNKPLSIDESLYMLKETINF